MASSEPSLASHIKLLDKHVESQGGINKLNPDLDMPRFRLLREACDKDDFFYVALHQVFCLWTTNPGMILGRLQPCDDRFLSMAFRIVGGFIKENDALAPVNIRWFCQFPANFGDLVIRSSKYRLAVTRVGRFLEKLYGQWFRYSEDCLARGYPPLVDELVQRLSLLSPVLQQIVFTATRRNLDVKDDNFGYRMEELFKFDQQQHGNLTRRYNTSSPPTEKEIDERQESLRREYIALRFQQMQARHASSVPTTPAVITAPSSSHSLNQTAHASTPQQGNGPLNQHLPSNTNPGEPTRTSSAIAHTPSSAQTLANNGNLSYGPRQNSLHSPNVGQSSSFPAIPPVQNLMDGSNQGNQLAPLRWAPAQQQFYSPRTLPSPHAQSPVNVSSPGFPDQHATHMARQQQAAILHRYNAQMAQTQYATTASHPNSGQIVGSPTQTNPPFQRQSQQLGPNRHDSPHQALIQTPMHVATATPQITLVRDYLFPPSGFILSPQPPNPDMTALHQAHVRSPRLVLAHLDKTTTTNEVDKRCYQAINEFALPPTELATNSSLSRFKVQIPESIFSKIAETDPTSRTRKVYPGSYQCRLRCVQMKSRSTLLEAEWVVSDTKWPSSIFIEIDGKMLDVRRKVHYGKDLPIDLTSYIFSNGCKSYNLYVSIPGKSQDNEGPFAIAVELVQLYQHAQLKKTILSEQRIPASETLSKIRNSLAPSATDDDDLITIPDDLTIDLADPFTATIFNVPVKGETCLHRECFDMETFLTTRLPKPKSVGEPSMVDVWKCPICSRDARPSSLRVDDFLLDVRKELEMQGNLAAKAMIMKPDGSWKAKVEKEKRKGSKDTAAPGAAEYEDESEEDENTFKPVAKRSRTSTEERAGFNTERASVGPAQRPPQPQANAPVYIVLDDD
jgi:hypothetical protein